jgi:hypothetical protein
VRLFLLAAEVYGFFHDRPRLVQGLIVGIVSGLVVGCGVALGML